LGVPGAVFKRLLPTEPATEPQLMLDTLLLVEIDGEECLVDIEMQTDLDKSMPRRLFEYGARASIVQGKPVISVVVWLEKGKGKVPASPYQMQAGHYRLATWPFVSVELYQLDASATINTGGVGLLPLVPFMQGGADVQVAERAMERVRQEAPSDQANELASLLAVFIDRVQGTQAALAILRRFNMSSDILRESGLVKPILDQSARRMAIAALKLRFDPLPEDVVAAVNAADEATLQELVEHAANESLELLRARLGLS
jgi:hypothetical protein